MMSLRDDRLNAFNGIMGDCAGVNILDLSAADVIDQARDNAACGDYDVDKETLELAIAGLEIYREDIMERAATDA